MALATYNKANISNHIVIGTDLQVGYPYPHGGWLSWGLENLSLLIYLAKRCKGNTYPGIVSYINQIKELKEPQLQLKL